MTYLILIFQASKDVVINMEGALEEEKLSLGPQVESTKVLNPTNDYRSYTQQILYDGRPLVIRTEPISSAMIKLDENKYGKFAIIPVSQWLRQQFNTIEQFLLTNVRIPDTLGERWRGRNEDDSPYKKIWTGNTIYFPVSNWCKYYKQETDYLSEIVPTDIGEGTLELCIKVANVFLAQLKDNKLAAVTMRIEDMLYKPSLPDIQIILDDILKTEGEQQNAKRRRKKKDN